MTKDSKLSLDVFLRLKRESQFTSIKNDFDGLEQQILKEVCENEVIDMNALCNIIDLIVYLPKSKAKVNPGSLSPNIFMILSSNQRQKASA